MRVFVATLSFVLALTVGFNCAPRMVATLYEKTFLFFTKSEAEAMVGKRVRNVFDKDYFSDIVNAKCDYQHRNFGTSSSCEIVSIGETGEIVESKQFSDGKYFIAIKWDKLGKNGEQHYGYVNRFTSRLFLKFE